MKLTICMFLIFIFSVVDSHRESTLLVLEGTTRVSELRLPVFQVFCKRWLAFFAQGSVPEACHIARCASDTTSIMREAICIHIGQGGVQLHGFDSTRCVFCI